MAIARAVLWNSKLVILDEPTAALGVAQTEQVLNLVRRLADNGLGVVLISHNMNDVMQVADNIACLYLGRMAAQVAGGEVNHGRDRRADHHRSQRRPRPATGGCATGGVGMSTTEQTTDVDVAAAGDQAGIGQAMRDYFDRVKGGDVGLAACRPRA